VRSYSGLNTGRFARTRSPLARHPLASIGKHLVSTLKRLSVLLGLGLAGLQVLHAAAPPKCLMEPRHVMIRLPETDLVWVKGEDWEDRCDDVAAGSWIRRPSKVVDVMVFADGPQGSGLFWNVTLGIADKKDPKPYRGACFSTSTMGARTLSAEGRRTLRYFKSVHLPVVTDLPWVDDLDADGHAEVIVWGSFPIVEEAEVYEFGLVAWVYQVQPTGTIEIDWNLSRRLAREIAAAYRSSLKKERAVIRRDEGALWQTAANALEAFASKRCTPAAEVAR